jgi:hypothetical protein
LHSFALFCWARVADCFAWTRAYIHSSAPQRFDKVERAPLRGRPGGWRAKPWQSCEVAKLQKLVPWPHQWVSKLQTAILGIHSVQALD